MNTDSANRSNRELRQKIFFYAESDVEFYDSDADLNTPRYSDMHHFAQILAVRLISDHWSPIFGNPACPMILDIGSGTGTDSLGLLTQFPTAMVVAADLCAPMHEVFQKKASKLLGKDEANRRIRYVTGDISDVDSIFPQIQRACREMSGNDVFHVAISALALHHLTLEEKRRVYPAIRNALAPDGFFLNSDFFGFGSPTMQSAAQEATLTWIREQHDSEKTDYPNQLSTLGDEASRIRDEWIHHCENYNILLPASMESQTKEMQPEGDLQLLLSSGFNHASCPFRYWQSSVILAEA